MTRRLAAAAGAIPLALVVLAAPAAAHGVGGREDLPLEFWQFAWAAAAAVLVSFFGLVYFWPRSVLPRLARGHALPRPAEWLVAAVGLVARMASVVLAALVVVAGFAGQDNLAVNLAPTSVYVILWVGVQAAAALLGHVWGPLSPYDTIAVAIDGLRGRRPPAPCPEWAGWVGASSLGGFLWMELAYHNGASPRTLAWAIVGYSVAMIAGAIRYGRVWLSEADGFSVLFGLLARMAPFGRGDDGRLRIRPPVAGLSTAELTTPAVVAVLVVLGGTTFDGFSESETWLDLVGRRTGWESTIVSTLGLIWVIAMVALLYVGASYAIAVMRDLDTVDPVRDFGHSLVPIVLGYAVAHYFSLFAWRVQTFVARLSDPLGDGSDWFGTADLSVNPAPFSNDTIAWVQVGSIVAGHVAGVVVAHDRAVERWEPADAVRSQYVMLGVMVVYSVLGLWLLMAA